jgi:PKD repeat protein
MVALPSRPHRSRARRLAAGLTAAVAVLVAPAAGHAAPWADSAAFTPGPNAYNIHLATQPDGSATAAWLSVPGSTAAPAAHAPAQLFVQRTDGAGTATTPTQLAAIAPVGSAGGDPSPADSSVVIAPGPSGSSVVAWSFPKTQTTDGIAVAFVSAAGAVTRQLDVATVDGSGVALGVDARGIATLAYDDGTQVVAAHIAPDGTTTTTALGGNGGSTHPVVGVTPGGIAWVAWTTDNGLGIVRLDANGAIDSGPQTIAADAGALFPITLTLAPDASGAVAGIIDQQSKEVVGARLALTGSVVGSPFHTAAPPGDASVAPFAPALALSPNGVMTSGATYGRGQGVFTMAERFAPGAATGAAIDPFAGDTAATFPGIKAGSDGRVAFAWVSLTGNSNPVQLRVMAADGSYGPVTHVDDVAYYAVDQTAPFLFNAGLLPFFTSGGEVRLGVLDDFPLAAGAVRVLGLDDTPPATAVSIPAAGTVGVPVSFGVTATDAHGVTGVAWDFGDGSSAAGPSVTHTYGAAGTYTVKLTVTDGVGNTAVVTRALTISAAPPSAVVTVPLPPPPHAPALNAAKLVITKATRNGRKVTVTGTIARTASGKVTIAYTQKVGGARITQRKTAKISKGRFTVTITLPSGVVKARTVATVAVTYAGDADTLKGTAKHAVAKARKKATKRIKR